MRQIWGGYRAGMKRVLGRYEVDMRWISGGYEVGVGFFGSVFGVEKICRFSRNNLP